MKRGRELTEKEVSELKVGDWVWVFWEKSPGDVIFDGPYEVHDQNSLRKEFTVLDPGPQEFEWTGWAGGPIEARYFEVDHES
jgi:hypothetical protein